MQNRELLMSPVEWFYAHGDEQSGPVSAAELKQMAASGKLDREDLVWREGMEVWAPAGNVRGLFSEALPSDAPPTDVPSGAVPVQQIGPSSGPVIDTGVPAAGAVAGVPGRPSFDRLRRPDRNHLFDILLEAIRKQFPARFVDSTAKLFATCGCYGMYVAMMVSFMFWLIISIKTDQVQPAMYGAISVLVLAVLQYVASRFCDALDRLNRTTSSTISSSAFIDCFALLAIATGVAMLATSAFIAVRMEEYSGILYGLTVFVVCQYLAFVALNPQTLSISVVPEARAGEEAIGVLSFILKAVLRLVPVAFGAAVIYGTLMLIYACYQIFNDRLAEAMVTAGDANWKIIYAAALPFVTYIFFLIYYLSIDVCRAVLSLPGKLDKLAEKDEQKQ